MTSVLEPLIATGSRLDMSAEEPQRLVGTEELWDELDLPEIDTPPRAATNEIYAGRPYAPEAILNAETAAAIRAA